MLNIITLIWNHLIINSNYNSSHRIFRLQNLCYKQICFDTSHCFYMYNIYSNSSFVPMLNIELICERKWQLMFWWIAWWLFLTFQDFFVCVMNNVQNISAQNYLLPFHKNISLQISYKQIHAKIEWERQRKRQFMILI